MTTIATLAVKLIGDAQALQKALDDTDRSVGTWSSNVSARMQEVGAKMMQLGSGLTVGLTTPIVLAGKKVLDAASDYEETRNKIQVVFGDMSQSVLAWSENSAQTMGQSRQQALEAAGTYGNLFTTLGLGQQPAAEMSTSLVQLASDLASFNNANPSDVLQAIQSGMVGQVEPMRKFGVNLSESAVAAKALELGLVDAGGELTESAKAQARYALILEQTKTAQGDFARTADGMANQQRILNAQIADAAAVLGVQLLPYALQFIQFLSQLVTWFQALTPEQQKWIIAIAAVLAVLGPLLIGLGFLISAIGAIIPVVAAVAGFLTGPLGIALLVIIAYIALLYLAWTNNWGGIQQKTAEAVEFVKGLIAAGMQFIHALTSGQLGVISQLWSNTWNTIKLFFQTFITNVMLIYMAFKAAFSGDWTRFGELLRMAWDNAWRMIGIVLSTAWTNFKLILSTMVANVINFIKTTDWASVGQSIVQGIANGIRAGAKWVTDAARSVAQAALNAAKGFLGIRSPSKLFEMQVGWQMAAGTALGWERGLGEMLPPSMPQLAAAPTAAVAGLAAAPGIEGGAGAMNVNIFVTSPGILDEKDIANRIGDAVEVVLRERGYTKK